MKKAQLSKMTVDQLLDRYVEIGTQQDEALFNDAFSRFNRLFDKMVNIEKELQSRGLLARRALMRLYEHPNRQVRLNAAKETLAVAPTEARNVIEEIRDSKWFPQFFDAAMTIRGLDDGTYKPE